MSIRGKRGRYYSFRSKFHIIPAVWIPRESCLCSCLWELRRKFAWEDASWCHRERTVSQVLWYLKDNNYRFMWYWKNECSWCGLTILRTFRLPCKSIKHLPNLPNSMGDDETTEHVAGSFFITEISPKDWPFVSLPITTLITMRKDIWLRVITSDNRTNWYEINAFNSVTKSCFIRERVSERRTRSETLYLVTEKITSSRT